MPTSAQYKPSSLATILIIHKCAVTTSLRRARQLHAHLLTSAPDPDMSPLFLRNNLLSMYARAGSFADAQLMFDKMPQRNIVSYNALISSYSRSPHHAHLAFNLFNQLKNERFSHNKLTITSILQALAGTGDLLVGSSLHSQCLKNGFLDLHVQTSLLGMYSSCGNVACARKVFLQMMDRDVVTWNSIISAYVKNGRLVESIGHYASMLRNGISPAQFTYSLILNACAKLRDYDCGKLVHAHVILSGTDIDLPLQNSLLDMYCSCGDTDTAFDVFAKIKNPDLVSWNSIIGGYSENGDGHKVIEMFAQLQQESFLKPDDYTLAVVISGTAGLPACACGEPLHAQAEKTGLLGSVHVGSALISTYFRNEDSESSQKIFSSFQYKDVVLWTDMIAGHVKIGESEDALTFFLGMSKEGCSLDSFALSSGLSACADLVTLTQGEMIHCLAIKVGYDTTVSVGCSLIDMYAKNGELKASVCAFSSLPKCDLKCLNSMLTGFSHHGKAKEAFHIFYKMLKHGLRPDQVTYLSLLAACSHCGLVDKCRYFWNHMKENSLQSGPNHYSCVISSLSRAGLWKEAEELIIESPFVDDYLESWRTILSSSIRKGNLGVGIHAAEQILNINAEDSATNVLLTNLYAASGRWNDVAEIRRRMRNLTLEKDPGLSWVEVENNIHVFSSGDQSHVQSSEMKAELRKILGNSKPKVEEEIALFTLMTFF